MQSRRCRRDVLIGQIGDGLRDGLINNGDIVDCVQRVVEGDDDLCRASRIVQALRLLGQCHQLVYLPLLPPTERAALITWNESFIRASGVTTGGRSRQARANLRHLPRAPVRKAG